LAEGRRRYVYPSSGPTYRVAYSQTCGSCRYGFTHGHPGNTNTLPVFPSDETGVPLETQITDSWMLMGRVLRLLRKGIIG
jgi:hypothetical protein